MSIELLKAFMEKYATVETCALTDDELALVTGGSADSHDRSIKFMENYCKNIPIRRIREECESALESLKESF